MNLSKIEPGDSRRVNVFIECVKGSRDFCEYNQKAEVFVLKKVLRYPFPGCYGFVPRTHHIDAELLDVLVLTTDPLQQGIIAQAKPIGIIRLKNKLIDDIIIAVSLADKTFEKVSDLLSLEDKVIKELKGFLEELKGMEVENVFGAEHARRAVEHAIELYKREFE
jgi:inorganic pyrophosphatase